MTTERGSETPEMVNSLMLSAWAKPIVVATAQVSRGYPIRRESPVAVHRDGRPNAPVLHR
jgi:hypothetical protein